MKISKNANFSDEYCATIVTIGDISPIDGKDRIVKTLVNGNSIVIGKNDFNTGDVAVYVSNECVIHELFLHLNNMYDEKELNADQTQRGYINNKGRVRVIRLGGIPSYGILLTPKSIAKFINEPEESVVTFLNKHIGEDFDEINGERFCHVYVPPVKKEGSRQLSKDERNAKKLARFKMLIEGSFRFHYETKQLQKYIRFINPHDILIELFRLLIIKLRQGIMSPPAVIGRIVRPLPRILKLEEASVRTFRIYICTLVVTLLIFIYTLSIEPFIERTAMVKYTIKNYLHAPFMNLIDQLYKKSITCFKIFLAGNSVDISG